MLLLRRIVLGYIKARTKEEKIVRRMVVIEMNNFGGLSISEEKIIAKRFMTFFNEAPLIMPQFIIIVTFLFTRNLNQIIIREVCCAWKIIIIHKCQVKFHYGDVENSFLNFSSPDHFISHLIKYFSFLACNFLHKS